MLNFKNLFIILVFISLVNSALSSVEFFNVMFKCCCDEIEDEENVIDGSIEDVGYFDVNSVVFESMEKCPFCTRTVLSGSRHGGRIYHMKCINQLKTLPDSYRITETRD